MKVAALDLGTNSFLCLLAEGDSSGIKTVHKDMSKIVRLGQDLSKTGRLHPDAIRRAKDCLSEFSKEIEQFQPDKIVAVATSAARDAKNADELFKIGEALKIPIKIISGPTEALTTFTGALSGLKQNTERVLLIDIGGGSTEFILGSDKDVLRFQSIDIGCVRLTDMFINSYPITMDSQNKIKEVIRDKLDLLLQDLKKQQIDKIVAVAGTPTTLAAAELGGWFPEKIDGYFFTKKSIQDWQEKLGNSDLNTIINQYHVEKGRADIIYVGVVILFELLNSLEKNGFFVSTRGVRYGVALQLLGEN